MKKIIIILAIAVCSLQLPAQSSIWKINWDMNAPIGQTGDYIGKYSCRGVSLDASWFIGDHVTLGGSIAWGLFYEKTDKITTHLFNDNMAVTGHQQKYNNFVPLLFTSSYYFGNSSSAVRPYVGVGLGAAWSELMTNMGLYQNYDKNWMFLLAPEVGIVVPISSGFSANAKVRYLQGFWKDGVDLQSFTISIGFAFTSYHQ